MRALLPDPVDNPDLHDWYGRGWLDDGGVRVNFIVSADGGVSVAGRSRGLQTPGDNRVFAVLRDLADVVLVGSGTARAEGYSAVKPDARRAAARRQHGLAAALPVAVVSRSLELDPASALFTRAQRGARTIVVTCAAAPGDRRRELSEAADVLVAGTETVDLADAVAQLAARGLRRVLCEGGPSLFRDLVSAGVASEICLTVSPLLAGPGSGRIVAGSPWPDGAQRLRLAGLLEEEGALFCRYRLG
ncbi:MAG: pyrimidine reductase family protein [bacterium]